MVSIYIQQYGSIYVTLDTTPSGSTSKLSQQGPDAQIGGIRIFEYLIDKYIFYHTYDTFP